MVSSEVPERPKLTSGLRRIARINAWLLLVVVALLIFTGWGITHTAIIYKVTFGLVERGLADSIHKAINLPGIVFFNPCPDKCPAYDYGEKSKASSTGKSIIWIDRSTCTDDIRLRGIFRLGGESCEKLDFVH
jgi:hypothetical protein